MTTATRLPPVSGIVRVLQAVVGPAENRVLEISINGKGYFLKCQEFGYLLVTLDAKSREPKRYNLPADLSSCECMDFLARHDKRADGKCKHQKALRGLLAKGKLPAVECKTVHQDAEADALAGEWADAEAEAWHAQYDAA